ncbi:hypothetical protein Sked_09670 [Sanguibacter keddieii DSM 10542]|uniref:BMP family ABC transporter substrate-binding protein n=1 Tax=Sanguibacter keddieii (strain ATCC 51767 / DSM 10542 / NCFB 3025 / ST-74) TaxID=446469 RepID=D1BCR9_SANKS|nr:hypothetical protein [Sanguibacter keddieii]ACZ20917.1 hypothetical protein Sked_09670 [Sanguibacter keddieii DSM 10542]
MTPQDDTSRRHTLFAALAAVAATTAALATLTACSTAPVTFDRQHPPGLPVESVTETAADVVDTDAPAPGSTLAPRADPTDAVPPGLTLAVVVSDETADTDAAVRAVDAFADDVGATVTHAVALPEHVADPEALLELALGAAPDVVVVLGPAMLDALDRVSASTLDQQFLTIGAQLPEPTANVTAVVWSGSGSGSGPGARPAPEPEASIGGAAPDVAPRTREALSAGLAAVASGTTGYVLALP